MSEQNATVEVKVETVKESPYAKLLKRNAIAASKGVKIDGKGTPIEKGQGETIQKQSFTFQLWIQVAKLLGVSARKYSTQVRSICEEICGKVGACGKNAVVNGQHEILKCKGDALGMKGYYRDVMSYLTGSDTHKKWIVSYFAEQDSNAASKERERARKAIVLYGMTEISKVKGTKADSKEDIKPVTTVLPEPKKESTTDSKVLALTGKPNNETQIVKVTPSVASDLQKRIEENKQRYAESQERKAQGATVTPVVASEVPSIVQR